MTRNYVRIMAHRDSNITKGKKLKCSSRVTFERPDLRHQNAGLSTSL